MRPHEPFDGANTTAPVVVTTGRSASLFVLIALTACGVSQDDQPKELVSASLWEANRQDLDPWRDHAPSTVVCPAGTFHVDGIAPFEGFEVTTGDCNFMSAYQPLLDDVDKGDPLEIVLWHLDLDATLPGPAHAAVAIDGHRLWELDIDVPAAAELYEVRVPAPADMKRGAPVIFHVHNHGTNEWNFQSVRVTAPD